MPMDPPPGHVRQSVHTEADAYTAGRDQFILNVGSPAPAVPGLLPRDVPGFTGREDELVRLTALASGGSVAVTAVDGTAGVGKTALVVHAAYLMLAGSADRESRFPDGHLYADLRGHTEGQAQAEPGEVLETFLRSLGVSGEEMPPDVTERSGRLRELLASRRLLMVLDNAASEAQIRPLLPGAGGSLVLITSRSMLAGLEVDDRIDLDVLPRGEAVALLARFAGPERAAAEPEALARVAAACGCLPLALRIAGQLLAAHPVRLVAELAELLSDERQRLDRLTVGDRQVRAAFDVSYRQLADADARMFRLLGLHPGPHLDANVAMALAGLDDHEGAARILDRLALAHLITEEESGRFRLHDLLRLFARQACDDHSEDRDVAEKRLATYFAGRVEFLDRCLDPELRANAEAEAAPRTLPTPLQALDLFEAERANMLALLQLAAERGHHHIAWRLGEQMRDALALLRHLDDMLVVGQTGLAAARAAGDTAAQGRALGNLGAANAELRRFEDAISCLSQAQEIFRETGSRHAEATTLCNLGLSSFELRRFEDAISWSQAALSISRETGYSPVECLALNCLGLTYDGLGRLEEAISSYQAALAISRQTGDWRRESLILGNVSLTYGRLGRFEDAISSYQAALAISRQTGDRHLECLNLNNIGLTYLGLGRSEDATSSYLSSLAISREIGDRRLEGLALGNLGLIYAALGRLEDGIVSFQDGLTILREVGDRHNEGRITGSFGYIYQYTGRLEEAVRCWQDAAGAMRDAGDLEAAAEYETAAAAPRPRRRARWRRKR
jgi:tetratricopeptide (TPR) repeat protein